MCPMLGRPGCGRSDCLLWAGQLRSRQRRAAFPARRRGVAHKVSCVEEVDRALVDLLRENLGLRMQVDVEHLRGVGQFVEVGNTRLVQIDDRRE